MKPEVKGKDAAAPAAALPGAAGLEAPPDGPGPSSERPRWRPALTLVLSLIGLGAATYLTYVHYTGSAQIETSCGGLGGSVVNCLKVITSAESSIFGVPVALLGALFFVFMVAINLPRSWRSPSIWMARARLGAAICSMAFVLYLISAEALIIHNLCLWCTGVHVTAFILFIVIATGWQDTGWGRFRAAYYAEVESGDPALEAPDADADEDEALPSGLSGTNAYSRRVPRASRSERKRAASHP